LFLALACQHILMEPKAKLGDFDRYLRDHPDRVDLIRQNLDELARRQLYSPVLIRGMVDPDLRIAWAVRRKGPGDGRAMEIKDLDADAASRDPQWRNDYMIKPLHARDEGQCLTLTADMARKVGLARGVVDDPEGIYKLEGVARSDVVVAGGDWLDDVANFLRDPWTSMVLIMVGITCLILELKLPGVGLPGVIAAVCFVLFFWSHSQLNGQMVWLAILLFLLGLVLLGIEIFVLPGFGVCGVSGVLLVIGSLGLVAYGHWPRSQEEWGSLGRAMGPFGLSLLGAIVAAFFLARNLPNIPYANRLILKPAGGTEELDGDLPEMAAINELAGLLGAIGVAATPLRPAGKAQFGDDFIDVVAEGSYVPPGSRVRVIEIEGNRIVVKEV
jgi:membrane-bound serine protease (ClpP class)